MPLDQAFYYVDIVFLSLFLVEICAKLFGLGQKYLLDLINAADFVIIFASITITVVLLSNSSIDDSSSSSAVYALLPLFKVVRLLPAAHRSGDSAYLSSRARVRASRQVRCEATV